MTSTIPDLTAVRTYRLTATTGWQPMPAITCTLADLASRVREATDPGGLLGTEVEISADGSTVAVFNPDGTIGMVLAVTVDEPATTPDLTDLRATIRALYAAGWVPDTAIPMANGSTEHDYLHRPTGRGITVVLHQGGHVDVTLSGLTRDQAVGAVAGAGLAPAAVEPTPDTRALPTGGTAPAAPAGEHLAARMIRLKSAIATMSLRYGDSRTDYILAVVQSAHGDEKARLRRASSRRYAALLRLTRQLADLASQGTR